MFGGRKEPELVEQNHVKGWKYAVSNVGFSEGMHFWHLRYEMSSLPEIPVIALGICQMPIDQGDYMSYVCHVAVSKC